MVKVVNSTNPVVNVMIIHSVGCVGRCYNLLMHYVCVCLFRVY